MKLPPLVFIHHFNIEPALSRFRMIPCVWDPETKFPLYKSQKQAQECKCTTDKLGV